MPGGPRPPWPDWINMLLNQWKHHYFYNNQTHYTIKVCRTGVKSSLAIADVLLGGDIKALREKVWAHFVNSLQPLNGAEEQALYEWCFGPPIGQSNIFVDPQQSNSTSSGPSIIHAAEPVGLDNLPGLSEPVICPCDCSCGGGNKRLRSVIIHLNDSHKWTREEIADWLDTLDIDLSFKTPEESGNPCEEMI